MAKYNGHESWNAWNVSLWISNDEGLYNIAVESKNRLTPQGKKPSLHLATNRFLRATGLQDTKTPDGAKYSYHSVKLCLAGLD